MMEFFQQTKKRINMKGALKKNIRRKFAAERLKNTLDMYAQQMSSIKDEDVLKKIQKKMNHHKISLENTLRYLKRS